MKKKIIISFILLVCLAIIGTASIVVGVNAYVKFIGAHKGHTGDGSVVLVSSPYNLKD